jgi:folate-binding protein YgfZ
MEVGAGYRAANQAAAVFDRSARGKIAAAGADRRVYLHAMLTNDVATLQAGDGCYTAYLTPEGRMIADMVVLDLGDLLLIDLDPAVTADVLAKLDQFVFNEDVKLGDVSDAFAKLAVVGPAAAPVVAAVVDRPGEAFPTADDLAAWPSFRNLRATFNGQLVVLAASEDVGLPAFDLYVERPCLDQLASALVANGATEAGPADWEMLRVEAGRPALGAEMDSTTIPLEAGIESRAISLTKGCYPGQEAVTRVLHRGPGRMARKIVGLVVSGTEVPGAGDVLRAGDREAGRVTSAVWSPRVGAPIALAMVQRGCFDPGTQLAVLHGDQLLAARVVALPFVRV